MVLGITHALVGAFIGTGFMSYFGFDLSLFFFAVFGSLFADIDMPSSTLGRYVKPIGWLARHRGFFHSLLALVMFTILFHILFQSLEIANTLYVLVFALGYASHLVLDAITKEGIEPFWPQKFRIRGKRKVGSVLEWCATSILFCLLVFYYVRIL